MDHPDIQCSSLLKDFFCQSVQTLSESLSLCKNSLTKKNIHNARLALKNLKACSYLIDSIQTRRPVRDSFSEPLQQVFYQLGALRDIQVSRKTLSLLSSDLNFSFRRIRKRLNKMLENRILDVQAALTEFRPAPEIKKIEIRLTRYLKRYPDESFICGMVIRNVHETISGIRTLSGMRQSEKVVHSIRSNIKTLYYIILVFHREDWFNKQINLQPELLNQLQISLGEWHDLMVLKSLARELSAPGKKDKKKPWKYFILEEVLQKKQSYMLKRINRTMLPPVLNIQKVTQP